jgi:opacity protein-like surface antigen
MKTIIIIFLLFITSAAYTQSSDSINHFSVGIYGGTLAETKYNSPANEFVNSIVMDLEYRNSKEFSFFANVLYQFVKNDVKAMWPEFKLPYYYDITNPNVYRNIVTIGARYYLRTKKLNPYLSIGLSREYLHFSKYTYTFEFDPGYPEKYTIVSKSYNFLSVLFGAGMNLNISKKFTLDVQYNLHKSIEANDGGYLGFSFYGGLKYNIF